MTSSPSRSAHSGVKACFSPMIPSVVSVWSSSARRVSSSGGTAVVVMGSSRIGVPPTVPHLLQRCKSRYVVCPGR